MNFKAKEEKPLALLLKLAWPPDHSIEDRAQPSPEQIASPKLWLPRQPCLFKGETHAQGWVCSRPPRSLN